MVKTVDYSVLLEDSFRKKFVEKAKRRFGSQEKLAEYLNSRVRSRRIIRENVRDWKMGRHYFGYNLFMPIDVTKELCKVNKVGLKSVLKKTVKISPPWADPQKRIFLIKREKLRIVKKGGKEYLDIYSVLPKESLPSVRSKKKLPLFAKRSKTYVQLWSEASWRISKIRLKKFVKIDELFFEGAALYASEGLTKSDNYNNRVSFGNTEPALIKLFLRWLYGFSEQDYRLELSVKYNGEDCNGRAIKNFWIRKLPYLRKKSQMRIQKKIDYNSSLKNNFGVFDVKISNTVLKAFVLKLLDVARKLALRNKQYGMMYLRGLLAAEGSVDARPVLQEIGIGCVYKNEQERAFIKKLLESLGLKFCEGRNHILITHWDSFFTLYKGDALNIKQVNSISKKERFISGFKKHRKTQRFLRLRRFRDREFTAKEWQERFGLKSRDSSYSFFRSLIRENILLFNVKKKTRHYYINPEMRPFLESIWDLEKL